MIKQLLINCIVKLTGTTPVIPQEIYAAPNRECSVYFFNLAPCGFPGEIEVTTPIGRQDAKRWRFTPSLEEAGKTFPLQIEWKSPDGRTLAVCKSTVRVAGAVQKKEIRIMLLGDSLIECSRFPSLLRQQLRYDGYAVKFIGSHTDNGQPAANPEELLHEGIGGWAFSDFASRWADNEHYKTGNSHFLTGPGKFDFQAYLDKYNAGEAPDFILISLGANDVALTDDSNVEAALKQASASMDILVRGIRKAVPNVKIGFCLPYPGASQDAFGNNYGTKIRRAQYHRNLLKLWKMISDKCHADRNSVRMSVIPLNVSMDTEHNFPETSEPASEGSTVNVTRQTNALHANENGHRQISNTLYFWLRNNM